MPSLNVVFSLCCSVFARSLSTCTHYNLKKMWMKLCLHSQVKDNIPVFILWAVLRQECVEFGASDNQERFSATRDSHFVRRTGEELYKATRDRRLISR